MRRHGKIWAMLLAVLMTVTLITPTANAVNTNVSFSDVNSSEWYYDYVQTCAKYGIINGYGDGTFKPDAMIKRGEFLKLLTTIAELYPTSTDTSVHWSAPYWEVLNKAGVLETGLDGNAQGTYQQHLVSLNFEALEAPITRYEMVQLLRNLVFNVYGEAAMELQSPELYIGDYDSIHLQYLSAVEQTYGKGILAGDSTGSFNGDTNLTRAEAAKIIVTTAWPSERVEVSYASEVEINFDPVDSFSWQYRNMSDAERKIALFGDPNKSYFSSAAEAEPYMVTFQIKVWDLRSDGYTWYEREFWITVNKVVEEEVRGIFSDIYNLPVEERFPIYAVGGSRYTDTMRHSWGAAIDINPNHNYYLHYASGAMVGQYCYLNSNSRYCIDPDSPVVDIFAKYGWGWGGEGWTSAVDYMHFSILASGG